MEQQPPPHHQEKPAGDHVLKTPIWVVVIRGFQILISIIILGLCASLMHDAYLAEEGFSLAVSLFTWIGVAYIVVTEKVPSLHSAYHIVAVLVIDGVLMILWLAAFASMAARRASYVYDVTVGDCTDNGDLFDSKTCSTARSLDHLGKRSNVILFKSGLAMTSAIAGLGALMWLLFIAAFVWTLLMFLRGRKEGRFALSSTSPASPNNNYQMENKVAESTPMSPQTYPSQTQPQPPPVAFQENQGQNQYQQPPIQQQQQGYPPPQEQQNFGQYPPQQQQQQPIQPQMTGQSQPVSTTYSSELDGQNPYQGHPPVSPPPQQYQQPYPPQH